MIETDKKLQEIEFHLDRISNRVSNQSNDLVRIEAGVNSKPNWQALVATIVGVISVSLTLLYAMIGDLLDEKTKNFEQGLSNNAAAMESVRQELSEARLTIAAMGAVVSASAEKLDELLLLLQEQETLSHPSVVRLENELALEAISKDHSEASIFLSAYFADKPDLSAKQFIGENDEKVIVLVPIDQAFSDVPQSSLDILNSRFEGNFKQDFWFSHILKTKFPALGIGNLRFPGSLSFKETRQVENEEDLREITIVDGKTISVRYRGDFATAGILQIERLPYGYFILVDSLLVTPL